METAEEADAAAAAAAAAAKSSSTLADGESPAESVRGEGGDLSGGGCAVVVVVSLTDGRLRPVHMLPSARVWASRLAAPEIGFSAVSRVTPPPPLPLPSPPLPSPPSPFMPVAAGGAVADAADGVGGAGSPSAVGKLCRLVGALMTSLSPLPPPRTPVRRAK